MQRLEIRLFGEPRFACDGKPWSFVSPPRTLPLLAYLLLRSGEQISRSRLASTLWPDDLDDDARSNLRRHLHQLNRGLPAIDGVSWLLTSKATVAWNQHAPAWIDVLEFQRLAASEGTAPLAIDLYSGDLMSTLYDEWILAERERLRALALSTMFALITDARKRREYAEAAAYAERMIAIDEWREDALRALMAARYDCGDRSAALAAYERFSQRLQAEMGVDPMPETTALRDAILANLPLTKLSGTRGDDAAAASASRALYLPFVGRETELDGLRRAWVNAAEGAGSTVFVSGEPGVGKSRLAAELAAVVETQGGRSLVGVTSLPESMPYQCLADALRRGLPYVVNAAIDPLWLSVIATVLPEIRSMLPDIEEVAPIDPDQSRARLHEAFVRLFECLASTRPLVLVLEDLQWARAETIEVLTQLSRRAQVCPLLIVATYRSDSMEGPHPLRAARRALQRERRATMIALSGLRSAEIECLIEQTPEVTQAPAGLAESVCRLSEGNPLFAWELLRGFLETGEIPDESRGVHGVSDAIAARIERLAPEVRAVADVASTIGREFTTELVCEVAGWPESSVLDALGQLMDRHLVRETGAPGFEYAFSHVLIASVVYDRTNPDLRTSRHRRVAGVLESLYPGDGLLAATIARHWSLALDYARASAAYLRAADSALRVYAREEAVHYAREAYALADGDANRFKALSIACTAQSRYADVALWQSDLEQLSALASRLGDEERFDALKLRADFYWQAGDKTSQRAIMNELIALAERLGSQARRITALDALGRLSAEEGRSADSLAPLYEALSAATQLGDMPMACRVRLHLVDALLRLGETDAAGTHIRELRTYVEATRDLQAHLALLLAESALALQVEDFEMTQRVGAELIDVAHRVGDLNSEAWGHQNLVYAANWRRDSKAVREHAAQADGLYDAIGQIRGRATVLYLLGACEISFGRLDEAIATFERARPMFANAGSNSMDGYLFVNLAEAEFLREQIPEALEWANAARAAALQTSEPRLTGDALKWLGCCECRLGEVEAGLAHLRESIELRRISAGPLSLADDLSELLDALTACGRAGEADPAADELRELYARAPDQQMYPTHICLSLARHAEARGRKAEALDWFGRGRRELETQCARFSEAGDSEAYRRLPFNRALASSAGA